MVLSLGQYSQCDTTPLLSPGLLRPRPALLLSRSFSSRPPGTEEWHDPLTVPGSAGRAYMWPAYNLRVHRPLDEMPEDSEEARMLRENHRPSDIRPAYVCNMRANIKYSPKKMRLVASFIRGLSVEEAKKQLLFVQLKGAVAVR